MKRKAYAFAFTFILLGGAAAENLTAAQIQETLIGRNLTFTPRAKERTQLITLLTEAQRSRWVEKLTRELGGSTARSCAQNGLGFVTGRRAASLSPRKVGMSTKPQPASSSRPNSLEGASHICPVTP